MYDSIRLEKGMYHLAGQSFSEALKNLDPDAQYAGTPLEDLDAFERQLKRFDIRVSGPGCDRVEKFFTTTQSAVLFPEFVRRAVKSGLEQSTLPHLVAAVAKADGTSCAGISVSEGSVSYAEEIAEGAVLSKTEIKEAAKQVPIKKYGRLITATYETVRAQRIDTFGVMLRAVGRKLGAAVAAAAVSTLTESLSEDAKVTSTALSYEDLTALYGKFTDFDLTTIVASPANAAKILAFAQLSDRVMEQDGALTLPFGAKLIKDASVGENLVLGVSKDFALECVAGSDVLLETDRLIDCQLDRIAVSLRAGFEPLMSGAAAAVSITG